MESESIHGSISTREPAELLHAMRAHLDAGIELARQGAAAALRTGDGPIGQFFQRCLVSLQQAHAQPASVGLEPKSEEISTAAFAPGDGADDAQVTPEGALGKPGGWPAY